MMVGLITSTECIKNKKKRSLILNTHFLSLYLKKISLSRIPSCSYSTKYKYILKTLKTKNNSR